MSLFHDHPLFKTFLEENKDIIITDAFQELQNYHQHLHTSRFDHSLNVAFLVFLKTRHTPEYKDAMIGAFCHDLFIYNHYETNESQWKHLFEHPKAALKTTKTVFELTPMIENMILSHMWPLSAIRPRSKSAWWLVTMDKIASLYEIYTQLTIRSLQFKPLLVLFGVSLLIHQL